MKNIGIHLAYITTFILGIGMCIFIIAAIKGHRDKIQTEYQRQTTARTQCRTWADRLDGDITEQGAYRQYQTPMLPEQDPWGNEIKVMYKRGGIKEILKVFSVGPDGKEGTRDDIVEVRQSTRIGNPQFFPPRRRPNETDSSEE